MVSNNAGGYRPFDWSQYTVATNSTSNAWVPYEGAAIFSVPDNGFVQGIGGYGSIAQPITLPTFSAEALAAQKDDTKWVGHISRRVQSINTMIEEHLLFAIQMIDRGYDSSNLPVSDWCKAKRPFLVAEAEKRKLSGYDDGWDK